MRFKFTMLFQLATNVSDPTAVARRLGGWSESWYWEGLSLQDLFTFAFGGQIGVGEGITGLCPIRAGMLPFGAALVGQRIQQVDPVGQSQSLSRNFPGTAATAADVPQMGLLCTIPGKNVKNIRRTILRGIPDARVVEGEFSPSQFFLANLNLFFDALINWKFRGVDLSQPNLPVLTIDATGVIQMGALSAGFAVNDQVKVLRSRDANDAPIGGVFMIESIPSATSIKVRNWTAGACTGGAVRKHAFVYPQVDGDNCSIGRIVTKRVGRPFTQYRGRRSVRR